MSEILSLWRSPLDKVALSRAEEMQSHQPSCSIAANEDFSAMTIYNYEYYVVAASGDFNAALTAMFLAMNPGPYTVGGLAFVPQTTHGVLATAFTVPDQCTIVGSGGGGAWQTSAMPPPMANPFYHFTIDFASSSAGPLFLSCAGTAYTSGGKHFRSLAFKGVTPTGTSGDTCIYAGTENCRAINCTFTDIPTAFNAAGNGCALEQCTIDYERGKDDAIAVIVTGSQCMVLGPGEFQQMERGKGGPLGCTCISIQGGADHTIIANTHISDWTIGVDFSKTGGSSNTHIRNCESQSFQSALNIKPASGYKVFGVKVASCTLSKSNASNTADPVVLIDPNGGQLSDVELLDCSVFNMADATSISQQHGLKIAGGTNVAIIGGTYSNNSPMGGAGIAITGPCGDVSIVGANLQPNYPWTSTTSGSHLNNQQYGLLVAYNPAGTVFVAGCDMSGYTPPGPAPVEVMVPISTNGLFICDCLGYNDANTGLTATSAMLTMGVSASGCSNPYFGPSVFAFTHPSTLNLTIFGQTLTLSFGVFFLPSPYDSFKFSTTPNSFTWYGK